jgi:hypothetical protein
MYQGADHTGRRVLNTGGGGGGGTSTTYTSNIPEWLRPQTEALLGAATQEYFTTELDPTTGKYDITGVKPYTPYSTDPSKYFAPFTQQQQQVFGETAGMRTPGGFGQGAGMIGQAGMGGMRTAQQALGYGGAGYESGMLGQQLGTAGGQQYGGMGANYGALGAGYGAMGAGLAPQAQLYGAQGAGYGEAAAGMSPEARMYGGMGAGYGAQAADLSPEAQLYGRTAADIGSMGLRAEELGRDVGEEARQYARQAAGMGGTFEQMATDPGSTQAYMSPYMQNVVERQKLAAIEDAQRANLGQNLAAARQGTYGGARQALAQSQREAALEKQMGDIQAQGLQSAFEQAQRAQQFGVTTGLQGLQGAQAGLGTALQGGQLGLSGIGQAMAGQQAGLAGLGQAGQLYGLGMQGAQAGLSGVDRAIAAQQAGMQGAQAGLAGLGRAGEMYGLGMQGAQTGMQGAGLGLQGVQQQLAGTAQGMQGAGVGLTGLGAAQAGYGLSGQMGRSLADVAAQQQQSDVQRLEFQQKMAALPQEQQQQIINQAVQNFALAQESPFQRLSQYSGLLRGYATPTMTAESYRSGPNAAQTLAGLGTTLYGASMPGKKKGGVIEEGIDSLAIKKAKRKKVAK